LFAVGGAPAASHACLSRAPSSDRLLDPLRDARVVNDMSLEALARPIDVAGVLSTVVDAANATDATRGESTTSTQTPATRSLPVPMTESRRRAVPVESISSLASHSVLPIDATPNVPSPTASVPTISNEAPARRHSFPNVASERHVAALRRALSAQANAGARARVILESPVPCVDRLLALGTSSVAPQPKPPQQPASSATSQSAPNEVGRLLTDAVNRVYAMKSGAGDNPSPRATTIQPAVIAPRPTSIDPSPSMDRDRIVADRTGVTDAGGGFRGLAQRTLVQSHSGERPRTPRIVPETRTPSDLEMDSLDARVADSLARVIEREARRQGINVSEFGA
jgi:hypothetical protein